VIPIKDYAGPQRHLPWMTWGLIAVNVAIFLYQLSLGSDAGAFMFAYSVVPVALTHGIPQTSLPGVPAHLPFHTPNPVYLTLITAMFLHAGWLHIGGNMLFLYIFGDNVEDRMGHLRYLIFYLLTGVLASLAHVFITAMVAVDPSSLLVPSLGASGAISGVLGGYLVLHPKRRVTVILFRFLTDVPAYVAVGIWFAFQLISGLGVLGGGSQQGGIAYAAHVGGFVAGVALVKVFTLGRGNTPTYA